MDNLRCVVLAEKIVVVRHRVESPILVRLGGQDVKIGEVLRKQVPLDGARRGQVPEVSGHLVDHIEAARKVVRPFRGVAKGDLHAHQKHVADKIGDELLTVKTELVVQHEIVYLVDVAVGLDVFDLEVQVDVLAHAAAPADKRVKHRLLLERDGHVDLGIVVELLGQDGQIRENALAVELKVGELLRGERHGKFDL